jgi:hypothetical protein
MIYLICLQVNKIYKKNKESSVKNDMPLREKSILKSVAKCPISRIFDFLVLAHLYRT